MTAKIIPFPTAEDRLDREIDDAVEIIHSMTDAEFENLTISGPVRDNEFWNWLQLP